MKKTALALLAALALGACTAGNDPTAPNCSRGTIDHNGTLSPIGVCVSIP